MMFVYYISTLIALVLSWETTATGAETSTSYTNNEDFLRTITTGTYETEVPPLNTQDRNFVTTTKEDATEITTIKATETAANEKALKKRYKNVSAKDKKTNAKIAHENKTKTIDDDKIEVETKNETIPLKHTFANMTLAARSRSMDDLPKVSHSGTESMTHLQNKGIDRSGNSSDQVNETKPQNIDVFAPGQNSSMEKLYQNIIKSGLLNSSESDETRRTDASTQKVTSEPNIADTSTEASARNSHEDDVNPKSDFELKNDEQEYDRESKPAKETGRNFGHHHLTQVSSVKHDLRPGRGPMLRSFVQQQVIPSPPLQSPFEWNDPLLYGAGQHQDRNGYPMFAYGPNSPNLHPAYPRGPDIMPNHPDVTGSKLNLEKPTNFVKHHSFESHRKRNEVRHKSEWQNSYLVDVPEQSYFDKYNRILPGYNGMYGPVTPYSGHVGDKLFEVSGSHRKFPTIDEYTASDRNDYPLMKGRNSMEGSGRRKKPYEMQGNVYDKLMSATQKEYNMHPQFPQHYPHTQYPYYLRPFTRPSG